MDCRLFQQVVNEYDMVVIIKSIADQRGHFWWRFTGSKIVGNTLHDYLGTKKSLEASWFDTVGLDTHTDVRKAHGTASYVVKLAR
jgi:hypothetical protein